jgi:hypothetical protein
VTASTTPQRAEVHALVDELLDLEPLWDGVLRTMVAVVRAGNGKPPTPAPDTQPDPDAPLTWRQQGLDPEAGFIEEECLVDATSHLGSAEVWERFCAWWSVNGLGRPSRPPSRRLLGLRLNEYGFAQFRSGKDANRTHWRGLAWRDPQAFLPKLVENPHLEPPPPVR